MKAVPPPGFSPMLARTLLACCILVAAIAVSPHTAAAKELSDAELWAVIDQKIDIFTFTRTLYIFPQGRNKDITFVYVSQRGLYIFDTAENLAFELPYGIPAAAQRKLNAYRAEFAYVVKKTVQEAFDKHPEMMRAKIKELLQPKVIAVRPKTISDSPEPILENIHVSYKSLEGKHRFPSHLYATGRVKIGRNIHKLKTPLQYYSLPNMRVVKK